MLRVTRGEYGFLGYVAPFSPRVNLVIRRITVLLDKLYLPSNVRVLITL